MSDDGVFRFFIFLLTIALYFFLNRKKKQKPESVVVSRDEAEEERALPLHRVSIPPSVPPISRTLPTLSSEIERRKLEPSLSSKTEQLVSPELAQPGQKVRARPCRAVRSLRTLHSLQDAFVIREVFRRYDENE